jgi:hypothetical protein
MKDMTEKTRENRLRRMADRQGLRLMKCRKRDPRALGFGRYALLNVENNTVAAGAGRFGPELTIDEVEEYLTR